MTERPVTGSCERCGRAHDLLIPEPGSGDLHIQRIAARFAWCAGCDRLVGLSCCWDGGAGLCADCATALGRQELTDESLTRGALGAIASAAVSLAAVEARLRKMPVRNEDRARNAWEDAWLEAGALIVRATSAARVVRRRGPPASDGAMDRLATLGATWAARSRSMDDRLHRVGLRIHALSVMAAPPLAVAAGTVADDRPPRPAARGSVTTLAAPRTATSRQRVASAPLRSLAPVAVTSGPVARPASRDAGTAPDRVPSPRGSAAPMPRQTPVPRPVPRARVVAVPVTPVVAPAPLPQPAASGQATSGRGLRVLVVVVVVLLTLIGAGIAAATLDVQGGGGEPAASPTAAAGLPTGTGAAGTSASPPPPSAGARPPASASSVTFDGEPLGPLGSDADGIALVLGAPEVAALPTSFDRSLRLAAAGDGVCLIGPPGGAPARAVTIDVLTGDEPGADLGIVPSHRATDSVTLALGQIPGVAPNAWYRLRVAWAEDGAISLEVHERDGGRAVHSAELDAAPPPDHPGAGSVCVEARQASAEGAVHLDNVRVET